MSISEFLTKKWQRFHEPQRSQIIFMSHLVSRPLHLWKLTSGLDIQEMRLCQVDSSSKTLDIQGPFRMRSSYCQCSDPNQFSQKGVLVNTWSVLTNTCYIINHTPNVPNGTRIFAYMKGEQWPYEQGEMYVNIAYMEHMGNGWFTIRDPYNDNNSYKNW